MSDYQCEIAFYHRGRTVVATVRYLAAFVHSFRVVEAICLDSVTDESGLNILDELDKDTRQFIVNRCSDEAEKTFDK